MGKNAIELFEGNDLIVITTVTGISSLNGFEAKLVVKKRINSATEEFEVPGVIVGLEITSPITGEQNDIEPGNYIFEVTVNSGTKDYTVTQDRYKIKGSLEF